MEKEKPRLDCKNCYFFNSPDKECAEHERKLTVQEIKKGCEEHSGFPWFPELEKGPLTEEDAGLLHEAILSDQAANWTVPTGANVDKLK